MKADAGPWRYYIDWFAYPAIVLTIAVFTLDSWQWLLWSLAGAIFWTFVEYWTHRSILHRWFWHGTHENHHKSPAEFVVFPLWYLPAIFVAIFAVFWLALPGRILWPFYAGFLVGYCWFLTVHHTLHHVELYGAPAWLQRYAIWHNRHHKLTDRNYGITTPMWDWLFRTSH